MHATQQEDQEQSDVAKLLSARVWDSGEGRRWDDGRTKSRPSEVLIVPC